jgi:hypothetical protein
VLVEEIAHFLRERAALLPQSVNLGHVIRSSWLKK